VPLAYIEEPTRWRIVGADGCPPPHFSKKTKIATIKSMMETRGEKKDDDNGANEKQKGGVKIENVGEVGKVVDDKEKEKQPEKEKEPASSDVQDDKVVDNADAETAAKKEEDTSNKQVV
jgi:hypothetical protein